MKRHKRIISYIIILAVVGSSAVFSYADGEGQEVVIDGNSDDSYFMQSDGQSGEQSYTSTETTNNTTSTNSTTQTTSEKNTLATRSDVYNTVNGWKGLAKETDQYKNGKFMGYGLGDRATNFTYITVPKYDIAELLNKVTTYTNTTNDLHIETNGSGDTVESRDNDSSNDWIDSSDYLNGTPSTTLGHEAHNTDYGDMSLEERNEVKTGIVLNEKGDNDLSKEHIKEQTENVLGNDYDSSAYGNEDFTMSGSATNGTSYMNWNPNSGYYNPQLRNDNSTNYTVPRIDLYTGVPSFKYSSDSYKNRFSQYYNLANYENWPSYYGDFGKKYYETNRGMYTSAALSDDVYIGYFTEYHIENVTKDYISNVNYTSDERRWTIYLNDSPVSDPVITDNPQHELNFTEVYQTYGAGQYYVVAEQLATYTKSTYVTYDKCEYLFDLGTGVILWFNESKVDNGRGGGVYLGTEDVDTPEWVATGDSYKVTVNDYGEIESNDGDGTTRVD